MSYINKRESGRIGISALFLLAAGFGFSQGEVFGDEGSGTDVDALSFSLDPYLEDEETEEEKEFKKAAKKAALEYDLLWSSYKPALLDTGSLSSVTFANVGERSLLEKAFVKIPIVHHVRKIGPRVYPKNPLLVNPASFLQNIATVPVENSGLVEISGGNAILDSYFDEEEDDSRAYARLDSAVFVAVPATGTFAIMTLADMGIARYSAFGDEFVRSSDVNTTAVTNVTTALKDLFADRKEHNVVGTPFDISSTYPGATASQRRQDFYWQPFLTPGTSNPQSNTATNGTYVKSGVEFYLWNPGTLDDDTTPSTSATAANNWVHVGSASGTFNGDVTTDFATQNPWSVQGNVMVIDSASESDRKVTLTFSQGDRVYLAGLISGGASVNSGANSKTSVTTTFTAGEGVNYSIILEKAEADKALPEVWVDIMVNGTLTFDNATRIIVDDNVRFNKSVNKGNSTNHTNSAKLVLNSPFVGGDGKNVYFEYIDVQFNSANSGYLGDWTFGYNSNITFNLSKKSLDAGEAFGYGKIYVRGTSWVFAGNADELASGVGSVEVQNDIIFDGDSSFADSRNLTANEAQRGKAQVGVVFTRLFSGDFFNGNRGVDVVSTKEFSGVGNIVWGTRKDDTYKNETWVFTGDHSKYSGNYILGGSDYNTQEYGIRAQIVFGEGKDFVGDNYDSIIGSSKYDIDSSSFTDAIKSQIVGGIQTGNNAFTADTKNMATVGFDFTNDIVIANGLRGNLRVYQFGSGTLTLTNTANDFSQGTWILGDPVANAGVHEGGTLQVNDFRALGKSSAETYSTVYNAETGVSTITKTENTSATGSVNIISGSLVYTGTGNATNNKVYLGEILSTNVTLSDGTQDTRYVNTGFEINIQNADTTVYWDATTYTGTYSAEQGAQSEVGTSGTYEGRYDAGGYDAGARTGDFTKSGAGTLVLTAGHLINPVDDGNNTRYNVILAGGDLRLEGSSMAAAFYKDGTHSLNSFIFCGGSLSLTSGNSTVRRFTGQSIVLHAMCEANGYSGYDSSYTHKLSADSSNAGIVTYYQNSTFVFQVSGTGNVADNFDETGHVKSGVTVITPLEAGRDIDFEGGNNKISLELVNEAILNEGAYLLITSSTAMNDTKTTQHAISGLEYKENSDGKFISNITLTGITLDNTTRQTVELVSGGTELTASTGDKYTVGGNAADIYLWVTPVPVILTWGVEGESTWKLGTKDGPTDGVWYEYADGTDSDGNPTLRTQVRGEGDKFLNNDVVMFSDSSETAAISSQKTTRTVKISGSVLPAQIVVNANNKDYVWIADTENGGGSIDGTTSVTKTGTGTLTINLANTYSGGTTISDGTVYAIHKGALGTGSVTVLETGELYITAENALGSGNVTVNTKGYIEITASNANITGTVHMTGTPNTAITEDSRLYAWAADALGTSAITAEGGMIVGREQNAFRNNSILISGTFDEDGKVLTAGTLYASAGDGSHSGAFGTSDISIIGPGRFFANAKISAAEGTNTGGTIKILSSDNNYAGMVYIGASHVFDNLENITFAGGSIASGGLTTVEGTFDISTFINWKREGLNAAKFNIAQEKVTVIASAHNLAAARADRLEKYGNGTLQLNSYDSEALDPSFRGNIQFMTTTSDSEFGESNGGTIILNFATQNQNSIMTSLIGGTGTLRFQGYSASADFSGLGPDGVFFSGNYEFAMNDGETFTIKTVVSNPGEFFQDTAVNWSSKLVSGNIVLDTTDGGEYRYFGNIVSVSDTELADAKKVQISKTGITDGNANFVVSQTSAGTLAAKFVDSDSGGVNLLKFGDATLTLVGESTTTAGELVITEGSVQIGESTGTSGSWAGNVTFEGGEKLSYAHAAGTELNITSSYYGTTGTVSYENAGTVNYSGMFTFFRGAISLGDNVNLRTTAKSDEVAAVISGTGKLTVAQGSLQISSNNTFSGGFAVGEESSEKKAIAVVSNEHALGNGSVAIEANGTLKIDSACEKITLEAGKAMSVSGALDITLADRNILTSSKTPASSAVVNCSGTDGKVTFNDGSKLVLHLDSFTLENLKANANANGVVALKVVTDSAIENYQDLSKLNWDGSKFTYDSSDIAALSGLEISGAPDTLAAFAYDQNAGTLLIAIPEPSLFGLLSGLTALALVGTRRRRRK